MKLGIGLPCISNDMPRQFFLSFVTLDMPSHRLFVPNFSPGEFHRDHAAIRNDLVEQAIVDGCTHLIMMDTDQQYPEDSVQKLISHDVDVVGAVVHRRYPPFDPIVYRGSLGKYHHVPDEEAYSDKLIEIDATGCGMILFNCRVFEKIEYPWFEMYNGPDGKQVGEDIAFCSKLKDAGFKIYADTSIQVIHLSRVGITRELYEIFKKINKFGWAKPPET